jgi:hypothetical protein
MLSTLATDPQVAAATSALAKAFQLTKGRVLAERSLFAREFPDFKFIGSSCFWERV